MISSTQNTEQQQKKITFNAETFASIFNFPDSEIKKSRSNRKRNHKFQFIFLPGVKAKL